MASIIQQPDALSFLKTLKAYRISSSSLVTFKLTKGSDVLVEETYAPDADGIVTIDVQDVTSQFLSIQIPDSDVYPQTGASAQFTAYVDNISVGSFRVVSGGVRKLSDTVSNWLKANWMTWQPQTKTVRWHQPEYLTYYHVVAGVVKAKFYPRTGAAITVTIHTAAAGEYNTYNTELAHLFSLSGRDADQLNGLVDIWVESTSGTRLSYVQRYVFAPETRNEHYYFCENSVGGLDTFCFFGARTLAPEVEHESAVIDGRTLSITDGQERKWNQNTGVVGKTDSAWLWDFFSSLHQWAIIDDNLESIVLDSSGLGFSDSENVGAYDFSFRLSDGGPLRKIVRSQDDLPLIEVPSPTGDLFFLAPRVIDYPDANLDDNLLVLVQSPFVQEWQKTSLGGLKQWVIDAIPGIGGSNVAWGTESGGTIPLTVDGVQKSLVTNVVSALGYTPANQAALSSYLTTSAAASTYQTKITSSNKLAWNCIASPTTISGYGITNAYTKTETDTAISTALSGYATESWVTNQGFYNPTNCNNTSTPWRCSSLTANGNLSLSGGSIIDAALAVFTRSARHSITNTLYLINHAQGAGDTGTAIVMGYDTNQYYAKIAMVYEDENPSFLRPALAFYTMDSTYEAGSEEERMRISANGNVGINTPSPVEKLHVVGNILATGEVTAGSLSDKRFKDNVQDFSDAMRIIRRLRPVTFYWNGLATSYCAWHKGSDFGLIAQEVAPILPSVISPIYQHYMRVDYSKLSALCIAGLQEHDGEIEMLKLRVEELENKLSRYES